MSLSLVNVVKLSEEKCQNPIRAKLKYATSKNFVGRPIAGYEPNLTNLAFMTPIAAAKLCEVQNYLHTQYGYGLIIYDAYRPKRAVQDFLLWSKQAPLTDYELERKNKHYPHIEKNQLFTLGYVAEDSGHCYGNTVDLMLINLATEENQIWARVLILWMRLPMSLQKRLRLVRMLWKTETFYRQQCSDLSFIPTTKSSGILATKAKQAEKSKKL